MSSKSIRPFQRSLRVAYWGSIALAFPVSIFLQASVLVTNPDNTFPVIEPVPSKSTVVDPCAGYDGVLHIQRGDQEGAAATIFFLFILNQLIFADKHKFLPWIHLNQVSQWVYDPNVHGADKNTSSFQMVPGSFRSGDPLFDSTSQCPIPPDLSRATGLKENQISGNGVWQSYFEPVSDFDPSVVPTTSCRDKPLVRLASPQLLKGLHLECTWSARAWRYGGTTPRVKKMNLSMHEWLGENRRRGSEMVQKYYRAQPWLRRAAERANPTPSTCLAVHIRHSDKANRRRRIKLQTFYPYLEAYVNATQGFGSKIYVATDSSRVIGRIRETWPKRLSDRIITQGEESVLRSPDNTAVFRLGDRHRTNREVLTDILAMAKCQFLLHGLSAVSEAVVYWNLDLHDRSVNLEDPEHMSAIEFYSMVKNQSTFQAR